jgi:hypothetical protein
MTAPVAQRGPNTVTQGWSGNIRRRTTPNIVDARPIAIRTPTIKIAFLIGAVVLRLLIIRDSHHLGLVAYRLLVGIASVAFMVLLPSVRRLCHEAMLDLLLHGTVRSSDLRVGRQGAASG